MKRNQLFPIWLMTVFLIAALASPNAVHAQKMTSPEFQVITPSKYAFSDTVDLLKGAIEAQNLMVIKEIDAQKMLRMVGVQTKGMKQLLFFHPRFMKSIMEINKQATIEPPLKIAVMEAPNGKVKVKYIRPSYLLGRYGGLDAVGTELDGVVAKIVGEVQK